MTSWREWELSADWIANNHCPECGQSLIITEHIATINDSTVFNGICSSCRKQYTVSVDDGDLAVNPEAARQQDRIDALEERVARLEAIVQNLTNRREVSLPVTPKPTTEEADFRKKYGYLF